MTTYTGIYGEPRAKNPLDPMVGKTIATIVGEVGAAEMTFTDTEGVKYLFWYEPDCCASCVITEIHGDLGDLIGSPLTMAEEVSSEGATSPYEGKDYEDSYTWTFYKFATVKGYVTVRWLGMSNGYYSEGVTFAVGKKYDDE